MSEDKTTRPRVSDKGEARRREREGRLAEALRENLRKRKDQARDRASEEGGGPDAEER